MILHSAASSVMLDVADRSAIGEARRLGSRMADSLGFSATQSGKVAIVVAEAATNLAQHARDGRLLIQAFRRSEEDWIEIVAFDKGPGIADVPRSLRDGYSTAGTAGQGLGAMKRLADMFDIYSLPEVGTALFARICSVPCETAVAERAGDALEVGALNIPKPGEQYCGDSWALSTGPSRFVLMVVDGLGHGPQAADAAVEARRVFIENSSRDVTSILDLAHAALKKTRGAAMAIAEVDSERRVVHFAGIGNIAGCVAFENKSRSMVSYSGIVGHEVRKIRDFTYPFPKGSLMIMHSDGVSSHFRFDAFPGLINKHPSLIAAMLYRDGARGRDDATIIVVKEM